MKNRVFLVLSLLFTIVLIGVLISSCKKESSCYDEKLYEEYKNRVCTMDCPGVVGCDGNTYCNECIANQHGIRVK